jgi:hypothetical protein
VVWKLKQPVPIVPVFADIPRWAQEAPITKVVLRAVRECAPVTRLAHHVDWHDGSRILRDSSFDIVRIIGKTPVGQPERATPDQYA